MFISQWHHRMGAVVIKKIHKIFDIFYNKKKDRVQNKINISYCLIFITNNEEEMKL